MQQKENSRLPDVHLTVPCLKERPQRSQEAAEGFMSFAKPERFDVGDDSPSIRHFDGGGQCGLPAIGNAVTDFFKESALGKGLNPLTLQIGGQGIKTLTHCAVAVMVFSVTLGTVGKIQ